MTLNDDETYFFIHTKGGEVIRAITSFETSQAIGEGAVQTKLVLKVVGDCGEYYITTIDSDNIEYIEEEYTDDIWERLLGVAGMDIVEEDTSATDRMFG